MNRNIVGAVVGVQPFGGEGKSGTGPKAGGPLYLKRLQRGAPPLLQHERQATPGLDALLVWANANGHKRVVDAGRTVHAHHLARHRRWRCRVRPASATRWRSRRAAPCCAPRRRIGVLLNQLAAALATGNRAVVLAQLAAI